MKQIGYIDEDGTYYHDKLPSIQLLQSSTEKQWDHDKQRSEHQHDLIQPYVNGKPNPEFIQMYREESKAYGFIKENT